MRISILFALLTACTGGDTDTSDTEDSGDTDQPGPTITISGALGTMPPSDVQPVDNGDVCFVPTQGDEVCTTSDSLGRYTLAEVPGNALGGLRFSHEVLAKFYLMLGTQEVDLSVNLFIDTPTVLQGYYDQTGVLRLDGRAVVLAELYPYAAEGWTATLSPASGDGPYYYANSGGLLDLEATATKLPSAMAVFLNVDPAGGPYEVVWTKDGTSCTASSWGQPEPGPWAIPGDADITYRAYDCL